MAVAAPRSRPPLYRILHIHRELDAGSGPNCTSLARALEVTPKTVQRDIEWMRDQLNAPIVYDPAAHAFRYTGSFDCPLLAVSEGELLALFVASQALASYRGTPFEQPLRVAFRKLSTGLRQSFTVDLASLASALSFHQTGAAETDLATFQTLSAAIRESMEVRFGYHKLNAAEPEERHVRPYHLACVNHLWYLLAYDVDRAEERRFALPRIASEARATGVRFTRPPDFDPAERLERSFAIFDGDEDFAVRLAFSPFAARLVRERFWHRSQKFQGRSDGSLEMTLRLGALEEVTAWILSWGPHCRVLAPTTLRTRVRMALTAAQSLYDDPQAPWPPLEPSRAERSAQLHLPLA